MYTACMDYGNPSTLTNRVPNTTVMLTKMLNKNLPSSAMSVNQQKQSRH